MQSPQPAHIAHPAAQIVDRVAHVVHCVSMKGKDEGGRMKDKDEGGSRKEEVSSKASDSPSSFILHPSSLDARPSASRVAIVGGGYAGMAAAAELARRDIPVTVFEAARTLGGRARRVEINGMTLD